MCVLSWPRTQTLKYVSTTSFSAPKDPYRSSYKNTPSWVQDFLRKWKTLFRMHALDVLWDVARGVCLWRWKCLEVNHWRSYIRGNKGFTPPPLPLCCPIHVDRTFNVQNTSTCWYSNFQKYPYLASLLTLPPTPLPLPENSWLRTVVDLVRITVFAFVFCPRFLFIEIWFYELSNKIF